MEAQEIFKHRLVGAIVLVALMVIFLPILFDGSGYQNLPHTAVGKKPQIVYEQYFPEIEEEMNDDKPPVRPPQTAADTAVAKEKQATVDAKKPAIEDLLDKQGMWLVQLGVFGEKGGADKIEKQLRQNRFADVYRRQTTLKGKPVHAVGLGPFGLEKAERIADDVTAKMKIKPLIKRDK